MTQHNYEEDVCIRYHYLGASEGSSSRGYGGGVCPRNVPEGPAWLQVATLPSGHQNLCSVLLTSSPTNIICKMFPYAIIFLCFYC